MSRRTTVIAGMSVAGVRTAQALRRSGHDGAITLIGPEYELPYDKPPLSKGLLAGTATEESIVLLTHEQARELDLTLMHGYAAARLDVHERQVVLTDGGAVPYDDLVIATGARARRSPWNPGSGVHVLRSIDDCRSLRADLRLGGDVVVVGAGFIGGEVASTCRGLGLGVTLVDPVRTPMSRLVGPGLGTRMAELHQGNGVTTHFGAGVEAITGHRGDLTVTLTDGTELRCGTVVVGIGAEPNDEWLYDSGLLVDDGVICDEFGRTSAPSVFALGDVARWHHPRRKGPMRPEHWTNAVDQARCVARAILTPDAAVAHDPVEFAWSDQHDWKMHIIGTPASAIDELTIEKPVETGGSAVLATAFGSRDGDLCGAVTVNWPKASITLRRAMAKGSSFADAVLALKSL